MPIINNSRKLLLFM